MSTFKLTFSVLTFTLFVVLEAFAIDQSICSSESWVDYRPDGSISRCVLKRDFSSNGIKCKELLTISFYAGGQLETCSLADDATVENKKCKALNEISFYPDGTLKTCVKTD